MQILLRHLEKRGGFADERTELARAGQIVAHTKFAVCGSAVADAELQSLVEDLHIARAGGECGNIEFFARNPLVEKSRTPRVRGLGLCPQPDGQGLGARLCEEQFQHLEIQPLIA